MKKVIRLTESDLKRIVRRVLNEDVDPTTPTGVPNSNGNTLILDKNSSLGILDGTEYHLYNDDPVFKNYNTTKKIPNGVEYYLYVKKTIDGSLVQIWNSNDTLLTITNGKLIGNTWEDLFSKFNKVSFNTPNNFPSDENDIYQSLLKNEVPCFEIDKERYISLEYDNKKEVLTSVLLYLNTKCDEKIENLNLILYPNSVYTSFNSEVANVIWNGKDLKFEKSLDGTSNLIIVEPPNDEVKPKPNDEVIPKPNDKVIPKPTLNNNNTPPTGVVDSYSNFVLDENVSLGILGDGEYVLYGEPLENDGKTKKIPDGSGYYLKLIKILNGYKVSINNNEALTIKDGILIGNTWGNLFSKINNVSLDTNKNELLSWEADIFESLLENDVPCFEIDKEKEHKVFYGIKTGIVNAVILYLKSTCNEKITSVRLTLDKFDKVGALVNGKMANTIWDGKKLEFKKSKKQELIIKVNENVRKVLRTYF